MFTCWTQTRICSGIHLLSIHIHFTRIHQQFLLTYRTCLRILLDFTSSYIWFGHKHEFYRNSPNNVSHDSFKGSDIKYYEAQSNNKLKIKSVNFNLYLKITLHLVATNHQHIPEVSIYITIGQILVW